MLNPLLVRSCAAMLANAAMRVHKAGRLDPRRAREFLCVPSGVYVHMCMYVDVSVCVCSEQSGVDWGNESARSGPAHPVILIYTHTHNWCMGRRLFNGRVQRVGPGDAGSELLELLSSVMGVRSV